MKADNFKSDVADYLARHPLASFIFGAAVPCDDGQHDCVLFGQASPAVRVKLALGLVNGLREGTQKARERAAAGGAGSLVEDHFVAFGASLDRCADELEKTLTTAQEIIGK